MDSIFIDTMSTNSVENRLITELDKKSFYEYLDFYDFDVQNVLDDKVFTEQKEHYNFVLRDIKAKFKVDIYKSILYLEGDFMPLNKLVQSLDSDNIFTLKNEMSIKYNREFDYSFVSEEWFGE